MMLVVTHVLLWSVLLAQGTAIWVLHRRVRSLRPAPMAPLGRARVGTCAPLFSARELRSKAPLDSSTFLGRRTTILFVQPRCEPCHKLIEEMALSPNSTAWQDLVVVCGEEEEVCRGYVGSLPPNIVVLHDGQGAIAKGFGVTARPLALIVGSDGIILDGRFLPNVRSLEQCFRDFGDASVSVKRFLVQEEARPRATS